MVNIYRTMAVLIIATLLATISNQQAGAATRPVTPALYLHTQMLDMDGSYCYDARIEAVSWQATALFGHNSGNTIVNFCGDADITVTFPPEMGRMEWWIKPPKRLAICGHINLATSVDIYAWYIPGGDANNDNVVTGQDWNIFKPAYGSMCCSDPRYDNRVDWNNDYRIGLEDWTSIRRSFATAGCPPLF